MTLLLAQLSVGGQLPTVDPAAAIAGWVFCATILVSGFTVFGTALLRGWLVTGRHHDEVVAGYREETQELRANLREVTTLSRIAVVRTASPAAIDYADHREAEERAHRTPSRTDQRGQATRDHPRGRGGAAASPVARVRARSDDSGEGA